MGFKQGALTTVYDYIIQSKFLGGDPNSKLNHGAEYKNSRFWVFVGETYYMTETFCFAMKAAVLVINVYYFFIRRWCLPECIYNIFGAQNKKFGFKERNKITEIVLILWLSSLQFIPGGHW